MNESTDFTVISYKDIDSDFCIWSSSAKKILVRLEPCPFCGSKDAFLNCDGFKVWGECKDCGARGGSHPYKEQAAINKWNRRKR